VNLTDSFFPALLMELIVISIALQNSLFQISAEKYSREYMILNSYFVAPFYFISNRTTLIYYHSISRFFPNEQLYRSIIVDFSIKRTRNTP